MLPQGKRRQCVDTHRVKGKFARQATVGLPENESELNSLGSSLLQDGQNFSTSEYTTYLNDVKATDDFCYSCFRYSIHHFQILPTSPSTQFLQPRRYGSNPVTDTVTHCNAYENKQLDLFQQSPPHFKYSWPSALRFFSVSMMTIWLLCGEIYQISFFSPANTWQRFECNSRE